MAIIYHLIQTLTKVIAMTLIGSFKQIAGEPILYQYLDGLHVRITQQAVVCNAIEFV